MENKEHNLQDKRCECCGYMTYQREHMGCIRAAAEQAPRWPQVDMGFGKFAVGSCTCSVTGVPGLLYLRLDEPRPIGTGCEDVFPVGSFAPEDRIASVIHFHSAEALQQTIDELLQMQREHYPEAEKAQQAEPVQADPAVAAIQFALETHSDGLHFLRLWNEGEFDILRQEWPEAPQEIYIGADPLLEVSAQPPAAADRDAIRRIFMAHDFTIKDGQTDLKPYVYEAAEALLRELSPAVAVPNEMESVHDTPFMSADTEPEIAYRDGWNACRAAMLAAMEQPK